MDSCFFPWIPMNHDFLSPLLTISIWSYIIISPLIYNSIMIIIWLYIYHHYDYYHYNNHHIIIDHWPLSISWSRVQPPTSGHRGDQDIIAILGMDELSEEDKLTVARARKARPPRSLLRPWWSSGCLEDDTDMNGKWYVVDMIWYWLYNMIW